MVSNWVKIENFPHSAGAHCESTSLRDNINFLGNNFSEAMIFGYIEEFGTGGAIFRNLYTQFLEEILNHPEINEGPRQWRDDEIDLLTNNIPIISQSAKNWSMFAKTIKEKLDSEGNNAHNKLDYDHLENIIRDVLYLEKKFFTNMNELKL